MKMAKISDVSCAIGLRTIAMLMFLHANTASIINQRPARQQEQINSRELLLLPRTVKTSAQFGHCGT